MNPLIKNIKQKTTNRPCVLSIAGFDPSGGAGILADIKAFEANKVHGLGVITAITFQNDTEFDSVNWIPEADILKQIDILLKKNKPEFAKLGLIKDFHSLSLIISYLSSHISSLIWDPILKASAGFEFHKNPDVEKVKSICKELFLITPNTEEVQQLTGIPDAMEAARFLSRFCHVYLKGGHNKKDKGKDFLFTRDGKFYPFRPKKIAPHSKHGTGCVFSSALTARLARGYPLIRACLDAKDYVTIYLTQP